MVYSMAVRLMDANYRLALYVGMLMLTEIGTCALGEVHPDNAATNPTPEKIRFRVRLTRLGEDVQDDEAGYSAPRVFNTADEVKQEVDRLMAHYKTPSTGWAFVRSCMPWSLP